MDTKNSQLATITLHMNASLNKSILSIVFLMNLGIGFSQSSGCDGEFLNAGNYNQLLCFNPNGGTIDLQGTASSNVIGFVWSDQDGEIARDNLLVEDYFVAQTTTITLDAIVIGDNQIPDGDFGSGDDFDLGFLSGYQTSFISDYVQGPIDPGPMDDVEPPRGDPEYVPPLELDGTYIVTDNALQGGFEFTSCMEPTLQGGNIAVFNLGEDRDRIICTRVQINAGSDYTFAVDVATVGEVTFDDPDGDDGLPDGNDLENDPDGDADGDGVSNANDCCPFLFTADPADCNLCMTPGGALDSDGDMVPDDEDVCPFVPNPNQDPVACSTADSDFDGVLDWQDNCVNIPNPGQEDRDGDGVGDACTDVDDEPPVTFGYCIPVLEFEIQGPNNQHIVVGEPHESSLVFCEWTEMVRTFTASTTGEVEICLRTTCPFDGGNLLAIDNLQFAETCRLSDQVTIHVDDISANILPVQPLDCNTAGVLLEGEWRAIYNDINNIEFFWFEDGQGVLLPGATGEDYFVEEPGTYNFSVLNEESGCFASFPIVVEDNFSSPEAMIEFPDTLSCINETIILDASASAGNADDGTYIYEWNGVFGAEFINGDPEDNSPIQEVVGSGTYELLITNTFNGCTSSTFVFVAENTLSLSLETPQTDFELDCDSKDFEFDVQTTLDDDTNADDILYVWTRDSEVISSSNQFESPMVSTSGVYHLVVTNQSSGCSEELTFNVTGEAAGPEFVVADVIEQITCDNPEVDLSASLVTTNGISYSWTDSNGVNLSPNGELNLSVNEPGTYTFTAIDDATACEISQEVIVEGNTMEPNFSIAIPTAFDCNIGEIELMALLSDPSGDFSYTWMDASNQILGNDINQTIIDAGAYTLQVIDNTTGCSRPVTINIFDNTADPEFSLDQVEILNCINSETEIVLTTSEDNLSYLWSTPNGNIVNDNGNSISVDMGGQYLVIVTDEDTGCSVETSFDLDTNFEAPNFDASMPNIISCTEPSSSIVINDFGTGLLYSWTATNGGSIASGINSNNPIFENAGDYTVLITNPNSGCALEQTFSVSGNSLEPEIMAIGGGQLGCDDQSLPVSVNVLNSIPNTSITWSSNNGGAFQGQTNLQDAQVTAAGIYEVVVTNLDNGCTARETIEITQDNDKPVINLDNPSNLDCITQSVILDASGTQIENDFEILWTSINGGTLDDTNSLSPTITEPDTYILTITNPGNGCSSEASVTVDEFDELPVVDLPNQLELSCDSPSLTLGGGNSSSGIEFQYQWLDENANPIMGANSIELNVDEAGVYSLVITNSNTGCTDSRTVEVSGNADLPEVNAGPDLTLDCQSLSGFLSGSAPSNATLLWTSLNGNIIGGESTLNPEIDSEGEYTLTATIESTGCVASSTVVVLADMDTPNIIVDTPELLNCINTSVVVNALSSTNSGVSILWTSAENNVILNPTSLNPEFSLPGDYLLTITDEDSGCSAQETIIIDELIVTPEIDVENEVTLDCDVASTTIGEVPNPDYTYQWTSSTSTFESSSAQINVNEADVLTLLVTDINSGCFTEYTVEVISEFETTEILALDVEMIDCRNQSVSPNLMIDADLNEVSLSWTTINGVIISGENSTEPVFSSAGEYVVEVTNLNSGCVSSETISVSEDLQAPEFDLGPDVELTCLENSLQVGIPTNNQNSNFEYTWTDDQGGIVSDIGLIDISDEGTYQLLVVNTLTGCSFTDQIIISENINTPEISAGQSEVFRCGDTELSLQGDIISNLNNFEIEWQTNNGRIVSGENTLTPIISQPGLYTFTLTNLDNQCTAIEEVIVTPDMDAPIALIDPIGDLTCDVNSLMLNAENSSGNGSLEFSWFLNGVALQSGTQQVLINNPGTYDLVVLDTDNNCSTTTSTTVELLDQEPQVTVSKSSDLDCDINEIALSTDFDSNEDLSFEWSTTTGNFVSNNNIANPTVNAPGLYILEIRNRITGCVSSESISVEQDGEVPVFTLEAGSELNCNSSQVSIIADIEMANTELIWTNLSSNTLIDNPSNILEVSIPGVYQLEVRNATNQCSSIRTIEVIENVLSPILDALQPLALNCDIISTTISAEISNEIENFEINWTTLNGAISSTDLNSFEIEVSSGGTYTIDVINTDNGCSNSIDIVVPENEDAPLFEIEEVSNITCDNPQISVNAIIANPNLDQTILWSSTNGNIIGSNNGSSIQVDQDGEYMVRIKNSISGCFDEQSVLVNEDVELPIVNIDQPLELNCTQLEIGLSASANNVQNPEAFWSTTNGNLSGTVTDFNATANAPGDYLLVVTNLDNGCSEEQVVSVTQNISAPTIQLGDAEELTCKNEVVALTSMVTTDGPAILSWQNDQGGILGPNDTESINVGLPGTYILEVTDLNNNCVNSESILVEMNQNVPTGFESFVSSPPCFGDPGSINIISVAGGVGPYTYSLDGSPFDPNADFDQLEPGAYTFVVMDSEECTYEENVIVPSTPELTVNLQDEIELLNGQSDEIIVSTNAPESQIASISWMPSDFLSCDDCLNPTANPTRDIEYTVLIENDNGCTVEGSISFRVQRIFGVYAPNAFSPNDDFSNDRFTLYAQEGVIESISNLSIYDRWGTQVFVQENFPANDENMGWSGEFRGESLPSDVYIFKAYVKLVNGDTELITGDLTLLR